MSEKSSTFVPVLDTINDIRTFLGEDFARFQQVFAESLKTESPLLQQVNEHLLQRTGKQLRPLVVLLAARLIRSVNDKTLLSAAALEMLHTASLVHDDVVDDSPTRRGQASVQARWTNKVAVLSGDYMLSKVIATTAKLRNLRILSIVAELGQDLSSGEVLQLHSGSSMWISEEDYYRVIGQKTAALFAACAEIGAVSTGASMRQATALRQYGYELGVIFQLKDDALDYSDSETLGKPTMADLRDGKATLPLIESLVRAPREEAGAIRRLAEQLPQLQDEPLHEAEQRILSFVLRYDGLGYVSRQMEQHKQKAIQGLSCFHTSTEKAMLIQLLEYAITRQN